MPLPSNFGFDELVADLPQASASPGIEGLSFDDLVADLPPMPTEDLLRSRSEPPPEEHLKKLPSGDTPIAVTPSFKATIPRPAKAEIKSVGERVRAMNPQGDWLAAPAGVADPGEPMFIPRTPEDRRKWELQRLASNYMLRADAPQTAGGQIKYLSGGEGGVHQWLPFVGGAASAFEKRLRNELLEKVRKDEALDPDEATAFDAMMLASRREAQPTKFWEGAARFFGGSVPFAIEFGMTGGLYAGPKYLATRAIASTLAPSAARTVIRKTLPRAIGVTAQSLALAPSHATDEYMDRIAPQWNVDKSTLRTIMADEKEDEEWYKALAKAGASTWIEAFSERTGGLLPTKQVVRLLRLGAVQKALAERGSKSVRDALNEARKLTQIHGPFGEVFEEHIGAGMRAVAGVDDQHDVPGKVAAGDWAGAAKAMYESLPSAKESAQMLAGFGIIPSGQAALELGAGGVERYTEKMRAFGLQPWWERTKDIPSVSDRERATFYSTEYGRTAVKMGVMADRYRQEAQKAFDAGDKRKSAELQGKALKLENDIAAIYASFSRQFGELAAPARQPKQTITGRDILPVIPKRKITLKAEREAQDAISIGTQAPAAGTPQAVEQGTQGGVRVRNAPQDRLEAPPGTPPAPQVETPGGEPQVTAPLTAVDPEDVQRIANWLLGQPRERVSAESIIRALQEQYGYAPEAAAQVWSQARERVYGLAKTPVSAGSPDQIKARAKTLTNEQLVAERTRTELEMQAARQAGRIDDALRLGTEGQFYREELERRTLKGGVPSERQKERPQGVQVTPAPPGAPTSVPGEMLVGGGWRGTTGDPNVTVGGHYVVVEAGGDFAPLISDQEGYDAELQKRATTDADKREGLNARARPILENPNRDMFFGNEGTVTLGVPIVTASPDKVKRPKFVLSGNARDKARRAIYRDPIKGAAYRQWLLEDAAKFGFDPAELAKFKNPQIYRVVTDFGALATKFQNDISAQENALAILANRGQIAAVGTAGNAVADASLLRRSPKVMALFNAPEEGQSLVSPENGAFVSAFAEMVGASDYNPRSETQRREMNRRIQNAILALAVGSTNNETVAFIIDEFDDYKVRRIANGITRAAAALVYAPESGPYSLTDKIRQAIADLQQAVQDKSGTVQKKTLQYLGQIPFIKDANRTPESDAILWLLGTADTAAEVERRVRLLSETARDQAQYVQDLAGGERIAPDQIAQSVKARVERENAANRSALPSRPSALRETPPAPARKVLSPSEKAEAVNRLLATVEDWVRIRAKSAANARLAGASNQYRTFNGEFARWLVENRNVGNWSELTAEDVDAWAAQQSSPAKKNFVKAFLAGHLERKRLVSESVLEDSVILAARERKTREQAEAATEEADVAAKKFLSPDSVEKLLLAFERSDDPYIIRLGAFVALAYGTGRRLREVAGIKLSQLKELEAGFIKPFFYSRKGKGWSSVPAQYVPEFARAYLRRYTEQVRPLLGNADSEYVFQGQGKNPLDEGWLSDRIRDFAKANGVTMENGLAPSGQPLRPTFATHLLEAGATPAEKSQLLLHTVEGQAKVTGTYEKTYGNPAWQESVAKKLSRLPFNVKFLGRQFNPAPVNRQLLNKGQERMTRKGEKQLESEWMPQSRLDADEIYSGTPTVLADDGTIVSGSDHADAKRRAEDAGHAVTGPLGERAGWWKNGRNHLAKDVEFLPRKAGATLTPEQLKERARLLRKEARTPDEERRLRDLNDVGQMLLPSAQVTVGEVRAKAGEFRANADLFLERAALGDASAMAQQQKYAREAEKLERLALEMERRAPALPQPDVFAPPLVTKDGRQMILFSPQDAPELTLRAHHGTPHEIGPEGFKTSKIGTGEGAQVYGWGLYFAENSAVATQYRKALAGREIRLDGVPQGRLNMLDPDHRALDQVASYGQTKAEALSRETLQAFEQVGDTNEARFQRSVHEAIVQLRGRKVETEGGNEYTVDLNVTPDELLDWDKPLSEQPKQVRDALSSFGITEANNGPTLGSVIYDGLGRKFAVPVQDTSSWNQMTAVVFRGDEMIGNQAKASAALSQAGIKGIRYLDQGSRNPEPENKWFSSRDEAVGWAGRDGGVDAAPDPSVSFKWRAWRPGQRTYNYVIFDENDIEIVEVNGNKITPSEYAVRTRGSKPPVKSSGHVVYDSLGYTWTYEKVPDVDDIAGFRVVRSLRADTPEDIARLADIKNLNMSEDTRAVIRGFAKSHLFKQFPGISLAILESLGVYESGATVGEYLPGEALVRLVRAANGEESAHEFLHHMYYYLSDADQAWVAGMWRAELQRRKAELERQPIKGSEAELRAINDLLDNGEVSSRMFFGRGYPQSAYHLANPREFFSSLFQKRFAQHYVRAEQTGFIARIQTALRDFWFAVRSFLKLTDKAEEFFRSIVEGEYEFQPNSLRERESAEVEMAPLRLPEVEPNDQLRGRLEHRRVLAVAETGLQSIRAANETVNRYRQAARELDALEYGSAEAKKAREMVNGIMELDRDFAEQAGVQRLNTSDLLEITSEQEMAVLRTRLDRLGVRTSAENFLDMVKELAFEDEAKSLHRLRIRLADSQATLRAMEAMGFDPKGADYEARQDLIGKLVQRIAKLEENENRDNARRQTIAERAGEIAAAEANAPDYAAMSRALDLDELRAFFTERDWRGLVPGDDLAMHMAGFVAAMRNPKLPAESKRAAAKLLHERIRKFEEVRNLYFQRTEGELRNLARTLAQLRNELGDAKIDWGLARILRDETTKTAEGAAGLSGGLSSRQAAEELAETYEAVLKLARDLRDDNRRGTPTDALLERAVSALAARLGGAATYRESIAIVDAELRNAENVDLQFLRNRRSVSDEVLRNLLLVMARSKDVEQAMLSMIRYGENALASNAALELAEIERLLGSEDVLDKAEAQDRIARLSKQARDGEGAARSSIMSLSRDIARVEIAVKTIGYARALFDAVTGPTAGVDMRTETVVDAAGNKSEVAIFTPRTAAANPEYAQIKRAIAETFGFQERRMIFDEGAAGASNLANSVIFEGFTWRLNYEGEDIVIEQPRVVMSANREADPNAKLADFADVRRWWEAAELYVDTFEAINRARENAISDGDSAAPPLPEQFGADLLIYNGLKRALIERKGEFLDPTILSNDHVVASDSLQRLMQSWALFRQLQGVGMLVRGGVGRQLMAAIKDITHTKGLLDAAFRGRIRGSDTHQLRIMAARRAALRSHRELCGNNLQTYREKVFNFIADEASRFGSALRVGMAIPTVGETVTAEDIEYVRTLMAYHTELLSRVTQTRGRGILEETGHERAGTKAVLVRPAIEKGRFTLQKHLGLRGEDFIRNLLFAYDKNRASPLTAGMDLSATATDPRVRFWNSRPEYLVSHILSAGREYTTARRHPLMERAEQAAARALREANDPARVQTLADAVSLIAQHARGILRDAGYPTTDTIEFVTSNLAEELDQYYLHAKADTSDPALLQRSDIAGGISLESEFTQPASEYRYPPIAYDFGAVSDSDLHFMNARALHEPIMRLSRAIERAIAELAAEQKRIAEGGTAANYDKLKEVIQIRTALEAALRDFDAQWSVKLSEPPGVGRALWETTKAGLLSPLHVITRNVISAGTLTWLKLHSLSRFGDVFAGIQSTRQVLGGMMRLLADPFISQNNPLGRQVVNLLRSAEHRRWLLPGMKAVLERTIYAHINQTYRTQSLGLSLRDPWFARLIAEWRDLFLYQSDTQQKLASGWLARPAAYTKQILGTVRATAQTIGTESGDKAANIQALSLVGALRSGLEELAMLYGDLRSAEGTSFDPANPKWTVTPEEWAGVWGKDSKGAWRRTFAGRTSGQSRLQALAQFKEFLRRANITLEVALWDYYRAVKRQNETGEIPRLFTDDQIQALQFEVAAAVNAATLGNRPLLAASNRFFNTLMTFQNYTSNFLVAFHHSFSGAVGQSTWFTASRAMLSALAMLPFIAAYGLFAHGLGEQIKRRLWGAAKRYVTVFDREFYLSWRNALNAVKLAVPSMIAFYGDFPLYLMDSVVNNRGVELSNRLLAVGLLRNAFGAMRGTWNLAKAGDWENVGNPSRDFIFQYAPYVRAVAYHTLPNYRAARDYNSGTSVASYQFELEGLKKDRPAQLGSGIYYGPMSGVREDLAAAMIRRDESNLHDGFRTLAEYYRNKGIASPENAAAGDIKAMHPLIKAMGAKPTQEQWDLIRGKMSPAQMEEVNRSINAWEWAAERLGIKYSPFKDDGAGFTPITLPRVASAPRSAGATRGQGVRSISLGRGGMGFRRPRMISLGRSRGRRPRVRRLSLRRGGSSWRKYSRTALSLAKPRKAPRRRMVSMGHA